MGYSLDISDASTTAGKRPIITAAATTDNGLYVHTTKIYRTAWRTLEDGDLAIEVLLEGDAVHANAAHIADLGNLNVQTGQPASATFTIVNEGTEGISSVDYELTIDGETYVHHAELAQPLPGIFSRSQQLTADVPGETMNSPSG